MRSITTESPHRDRAGPAGAGRARSAASQNDSADSTGQILAKGASVRLEPRSRQRSGAAHGWFQFGSRDRGRVP